MDNHIIPGHSLEPKALTKSTILTSPYSKPWRMQILLLLVQESGRTCETQWEPFIYLRKFPGWTIKAGVNTVFNWGFRIGWRKMMKNQSGIRRGSIQSHKFLSRHWACCLLLWYMSSIGQHRVQALQICLKWRLVTLQSPNQLTMGSKRRWHYFYFLKSWYL